MDVKNLIGQMTLEEKARFCSGADKWHIEGLERLGIPSIMMADGPHGLRKCIDTKINGSPTVKATCFPTLASLACSWDKEALYKMASVYADEAKGEQISIVLGPGINMKRSPTCGRNFEYLSEDPFLAGKLSASYIKGVQDKGVGVSLKHFAINSQETRRHSTNVIIDERTMREIYLTAFEIAVKEADPATIMHSYNNINGKQVCECKWLLNDILREEWGYKGTVMSDWNAMNHRVEALKAGCDLEMPTSFGTRDKLIVEAVKNGTLDEKVLDTALERILTTVFKYLPDEKAPKADLAKNQEIAGQLEQESAVLLKNEDNILPIESGKKLAVIGAFAKQPRHQGSGSSKVNTAFFDDILEYITDRNGAETVYAEGYDLSTNDVKEDLIEEAVKTAKECGRAVVFAGLTEGSESEGFDRKSMEMPLSHNMLVERVLEVCPDAVIVLIGGSPVEIPWLDKVKALYFMYLGGSGLGRATTRLLFGDVCPSGKLAETFPVKYSDTPAYLNYPGEENECRYAEGVFIGYRYYQKKQMKVNFPFGFGLSYTQFSYDEIKNDGDKVSVKITNTGKVKGKEIVQLYVGEKASRLVRPVKELKGFEKIELEPGESKWVEFELDDRSFAYYDVRSKSWRVDSGEFEIFVGRNCEDTPLSVTVTKVDKAPYVAPIHRNTTVTEIMTYPAYEKVRDYIAENVFHEVLLKKIKEFGFDLSNPTIKYNQFYTLRMFIVRTEETLTDEALDKIIENANRMLGF